MDKGLETYRRDFEKLIHSAKNQQKESGFVVKGDLSGIQSFIFNIPSKKASTYLKGRSAYVQLLSEVIARYVHKKLEQRTPFKEAIVYKGGGNFMLHYKDAGDLSSEVDTLQKGIEDVLYKAHHGGLYLALAGAKCEAKYQQTLNQKLQVRKKQKFRRLGKELFVPYEKSEKRPLTGAPETEVEKLEAEQVSGFYESFKTLADDFMKAKDVEFKLETLPNATPQSYQSCKEVFAAFDHKVEFESVKSDKPYRMVNRIDVRDFDQLAEFSAGAKKLALLKVDVDNLGQVFEDKSIDETKRLSDCLSYFFEEHLNQIIDRKKYLSKVPLKDGPIVENARLVYTVYSGGDDAFLVGPWNVMVELAGEIQKEFAGYAPAQRGITLSASLTIIDKNYPMIQAAQTAESWLHLAKERTGKSAICLFGEVFSWNEWGYAKKIMELLKGIIDNTPGNPKAIIRKVASTTSAFRKITNDIERHDELKMQSVYKLMYYVRDLKSKKNELANIYKAIILDGFLKPELIDPSEKSELKVQRNVNYMIIPVACRLAEFGERKN